MWDLVCYGGPACPQNTHRVQIAIMCCAIQNLRTDFCSDTLENCKYHSAAPAAAPSTAAAAVATATPPAAATAAAAAAATAAAASLKNSKCLHRGKKNLQK